MCPHMFYSLKHCGPNIFAYVLICVFRRNLFWHSRSLGEDGEKSDSELDAAKRAVGTAAKTIFRFSDADPYERGVSPYEILD